MTKLRHVGLAVVDMDNALKLYKDIFNLKIVWDEIESGDFIDNLSNMSNVNVRTVKLTDINGGMIELLQYMSHPQHRNEDSINRIGCSHVAMTVNNIDSMYKKLLDFGVKFHNEPQVSVAGNAKVAFCRDGDGILIELVEELA